MTAKRNNTNKAGFKEKFFGFASILGFVVDVIALWNYFPLFVKFDGTIEIKPITIPVVIFSIGSFQMTGETFTGFVWFLFMVSSIFAMTIYIRRNLSKISHSYRFSGKVDLEFGDAAEPIFIYCQFAVGLSLFWVLTFHPIVNLNLVFLIVVAWLAPVIITIVDFIGRGVIKIISYRGLLSWIFVGVITWVLVSFMEVGYFGTSVVAGIFYSLLAFLAGIIQMVLFYLLFHYIFKYSLKLLEA